MKLIESIKRPSNILIGLSVILIIISIYSLVSAPNRQNNQTNRELNSIQDTQIIPTPIPTIEAEVTELVDNTENDKTNIKIIIEANSFESFADGQSNIVDIMKTTNGIDIQTKDYGIMGEFIESINGKSNDNETGYYWILYFNNAKANVGASSIIPKAGDTISWKYEESIK